MLILKKISRLLSFMKSRKNNFLILGLLLFSLFITSFTIVPIENSTEIKIEQFAEENTVEKKCDDFILISTIFNLFQIKALDRVLYKTPIYTYNNIKSFNKPPISQTILL